MHFPRDSDIRVFTDCAVVVTVLVAITVTVSTVFSNRLSGLFVRVVPAGIARRNVAAVFVFCFFLRKWTLRLSSENFLKRSLVF